MPILAQAADNELPPLPGDLSHTPRQSGDLIVSSRTPSITQSSSDKLHGPSLNQDIKHLTICPGTFFEPFLQYERRMSRQNTQVSNYNENLSTSCATVDRSLSYVCEATDDRTKPSQEPRLQSTLTSQLLLLRLPLLLCRIKNVQKRQVLLYNRQDTQASLPSAIENPGTLSSGDDSIVTLGFRLLSTLRPEFQREVEMIVRKQEDELRNRQQARNSQRYLSRETVISDLRAQTQLDISRAPSPAEARPIKAIPVPEDWVPLAPRNWSAQRKYWAAAATCHLPLYFQYPVLERYGHSVEQFVGPIGQYLTYPLDDPTQSTQRNQILQPLFSFGLFAFQIAALPYNVIMDPPWEAQYDLGYYRPGDVIPTDLYWLPIHGYGPPLRGSSY